MTQPAAVRPLQRQVGVLGATMLGLGSIVGSGVFVSIGIAAGAAGPAVVLAIALAAVVATCNGLSSASLAANHPVSGGTYEYGYRWLTPGLGFTAGWMFVCAKSASAATAALGFGAYVVSALGDVGAGRGAAVIAAALAAVLVLGGIVLAGVIYLTVGLVALAAVGADKLSAPTAKQAAPLVVVADGLEPSSISAFVAVGATTAMLGVLLNLILGLSRVVLAMARRGDLPSLFAKVGGAHATPRAAVVASAPSSRRSLFSAA